MYGTIVSGSIDLVFLTLLKQEQNRRDLNFHQTLIIG